MHKLSSSMQTKTCILTDTICKICINSLSNWIWGLFLSGAIQSIFFLLATVSVWLDRCLYCKSRNNNKTEVKTLYDVLVKY